MSRPPTFVLPPCARARTLTTARGDFAALEGTPEGPPRGTVLLLPGFTGSKEDFTTMLEPLTRAGYHAFAVDGRGQYETPGPDTEAAYAQDELAADVHAQTAAIGAPVHLVGHSMGGQVARVAALADRGAFRSLTLMCSGPAQISPSQQQRVKLLQDVLPVMTMAEVWDAFQTMEPPEEVTARDGALMRDRWLRNNPLQLAVTSRQLATEPDRVDELAALRPPLPMYVLSGERDDTWPVPLLDEMARRLRARRTVIEGAEHSPNTDRPLETTAALTDFWELYG